MDRVVQRRYGIIPTLVYIRGRINHLFRRWNILKKLILLIPIAYSKLKFRNNHTYWYKSVPKKIWQEFLVVIHADLSAGAFFNKKINLFTNAYK